jgi:hypothetical protein
MKKNDLVVINLDRPRFLRYGHKALKQLSSLTNLDISKMDMSNFSLEDLEKVLYCGLLSDAYENSETLKLEDMEDLLDQAESFKELMEKLNESFEKAFGTVENVTPKGEKKN